MLFYEILSAALAVSPRRAKVRKKKPNMQALSEIKMTISTLLTIKTSK